MKYVQTGMMLALALTLLAGCSSTTLSGSWKNPEYNGNIKNLYIVGIAKQETNRRILEDDFSRQLASHGVTTISSYTDIKNSDEIDEFKIAQNIKKNGADSVLIAYATGKRTEEVVHPGRISTYSNGRYYNRPSFSGDRYQDRFYAPRYSDNFRYSREVVYQPATITQFEVVTVEANLYDANSKEMIWSAQLETTVDGDIQSLLQDFVKTVIKDLDSKGLI